MKDIIDLVDFEEDYQERILIVGSYGKGENKEIKAVVTISLTPDADFTTYEVIVHGKCVTTVDNLKDAIITYNKI